MITDDDVRKLKEALAAKKDIEKTNKKLGKLEGMANCLAVEVVGMKREMTQIKEKMATKDDFREVMTKVDNVFGEVKAMREEQAIHFQSHEDNRLEHQEFRNRLEKIKSVPVIAH